jgi:hypothetical protein
LNEIKHLAETLGAFFLSDASMSPQDVRADVRRFAEYIGAAINMQAQRPGPDK